MISGSTSDIRPLWVPAINGLVLSLSGTSEASSLSMVNPGQGLFSALLYRRRKRAFTGCRHLSLKRMVRSFRQVSL
jgi:hypothetical protein